LKNFKVLILLFKNQFTPSWFCPHSQTFRCAIPTNYEGHKGHFWEGRWRWNRQRHFSPTFVSDWATTM